MAPSLAPLRPLDIIVVLAVHDFGNAPWTYAALAKRLEVSDSQSHGAVQRAASAHLLDAVGRSIRPYNLLEFLEHGIRYAFPVEPGPFTRGIPTGASAPPLNALLRRDSSGELVWPDVNGSLMGQAVAPLHASVPNVARQHASLHQLFALVDALRVGGVRERELAVRELRSRLEPSHG
ncbi:MAG TPA: hypothetical protein VIV60_24225 [Polyangiaceae bacterium]